MDNEVDPEAGPLVHYLCPVERSGVRMVGSKSLELYRLVTGVPRIARREIIIRDTVLKPTQVGEASSLRCARELWLRNSAN